MTKQILIGGGVVALVAFFLGAFLGSGVQADADAKHFSATLTAISSASLSSGSEESRMFADAQTAQATATPSPTPEIVWSCVAISSSVPNAYQAILRAGNTQTWEQGPFKLIESNGLEVIVETRPELSLVHPGDQVCVRVFVP